MLEDDLELEGMDDVCSEIENLHDLDNELLELNIIVTVSAPLK